MGGCRKCGALAPPKSGPLPSVCRTPRTACGCKLCGVCGTGKINTACNGGAKQAEEKLSSAYDHPGARGATPPESGGELLKTLPSSDEEGWRAVRRGGADSASAKHIPHVQFDEGRGSRIFGSLPLLLCISMYALGQSCNRGWLRCCEILLVDGAHRSKVMYACR